MLLAFVGAYLLLNIFIGFYASRRVSNVSDFVVAGRKLPLLMAASAMFATWFGSETILGASTEFIQHGILGIIEDPFGAALCLILVGMFFARPLYRMNILTFNDFFRDRFDERAELISALLIVPSYFGWIAAQLLALAFILNVLAGVPIFVGVILCALIVVLYTYVGGMWAVSITDFVQSVVIIGGLLFMALRLGMEVGSIEKVGASVSPDFFRFVPKGDLHSTATYIAAWITIGLGSIPQQDVFQRTMAAKDEKTAVRASFLGGIMYLSIGSLPLMIALFGNILYPEILQGGTDTEVFLPTLVLEKMPLGIQVLFFGALLSAILSTCSGGILAPATVIGENLLRPRFRHWSDRQLLQAIRLSIIGVALVSAVMALSGSSIYELVSASSSFSLVSLFVPLVAGLYWKKATAQGAILSMVLGIAGWTVAETAGSQYPAIFYGLGASLAGVLIGSLAFSSKSQP